MRLQTREEQQAYQREWRANNRDRVRANSRRNYYRNMSKTLFDNAKKRAKIKGLDFNLTLEDINVQERCPVLGRPYTIGGGPSNKDMSPSLDRIDSTKGYVTGNVRVISLRANKHKGDLTLEEAKQIFENWYAT